MTVLGPPVPLDGLRAQLLDRPALPELTGERYAYTHARYEAASDQRLQLQNWLLERLAPRFGGCDPVRVVGVGVGDGSVDAPSAMAFAARLRALDRPTLSPSVAVTDFVDYHADHLVDLVHFVHSLYYVSDLSAALDRGLSMLAPGGLLVAAVAPLRPLCILTDLLCPWRGRTLWFAEDVHAELDARGLELHTETIVGHLDVRDALADPLGRGEAVLDFLIGARSAALDPAARTRLLDYVSDISLPGRPGVLPHPVDVTIARLP